MTRRAHRRPGAGPSRRAGFRGIGGGAPPPTPSVAGTVSIGSALTITPGTVGGPTTGYLVFCDGALVGRTRTTSFTCRASTIGQSVTVRAYGPGGMSGSSNALTWSPTALRVKARTSPLTPGAVSSWVDGKSSINLAQATGSKQPTASATSLAGSPGVAFATDDWLSGAAGTTFTSDQAVRIVMAFASVSDAFGFLLDLGTNYSSTGSFTLGVDFSATLQLVGGANGNGTSARAVVFDVIPVPAGGAVLDICLDTATTATGIKWANLDRSSRSISAALSGPTAAGNFANANLTLGAADSAGSYPVVGATYGPWVVLGGAVDDTDMADARAYVANLAAWSSPAVARVMPCGDSLVYGLKSGSGSNGGWRTTANAWLGDCAFVGPYTNVGQHRGVSGEKIQTVAGATATFVAEIASNTPDAMLWAWGVNDFGTVGGSTAAQVFGFYDTLYTAVRASYPNMPIMMAQCEVPTDGTHNLTEIASFNSGLAAWAAAKSRVYTTTTPDGPYYDSIHKTPEGYRLTGRVYGAAMATMLAAEGFGP